MILVGLIVSDVLVGPSVINDSEIFSPGVHDFIEEKEHDEGSGIKIPDRKFPNEEIRDSITKHKFLHSPLSVEGVIPFAQVVLLNV